MAQKRIKTVVRATRTPAAFTPRTMFLAGLGAMSLAQKQGEKTLEMLVDEGEAFKGRSEKFANTLVKDVRRAAADVERQVKGFVAPLRQRAQRTVKQVGSTLAGINLPKVADVQNLIARLRPGKPLARRGGRRRAA
jgi:poly(hydroxyalkanoate) granule-associated protein